MVYSNTISKIAGYQNYYDLSLYGYIVNIEQSDICYIGQVCAINEYSLTLLNVLVFHKKTSNSINNYINDEIYMNDDIPPIFNNLSKVDTIDIHISDITDNIDQICGLYPFITFKKQNITSVKLSRPHGYYHNNFDLNCIDYKASQIILLRMIYNKYLITYLYSDKVINSHDIYNQMITNGLTMMKYSFHNFCIDRIDLYIKDNFSDKYQIELDLENMKHLLENLKKQRSTAYNLPNNQSINNILPFEATAIRLCQLSRNEIYASYGHLFLLSITCFFIFKLYYDLPYLYQEPLKNSLIILMFYIVIQIVFSIFIQLYSHVLPKITISLDLKYYYFIQYALAWIIILTYIIILSLYFIDKSFLSNSLLMPSFVETLKINSLYNPLNVCHFYLNAGCSGWNQTCYTKTYDELHRDLCPPQCRFLPLTSHTCEVISRNIFNDYTSYLSLISGINYVFFIIVLKYFLRHFNEFDALILQNQGI